MRGISAKASFGFLVGLAMISVVLALPGALGIGSGSAGRGKASERNAAQGENESANSAAAAISANQYPPLPLVSFLDPILGPANARVTIVAFEDLLCSHCAEGFGALLAVRTRFPEDVRIVWKDLPLSGKTYPFAEAAHHAARCAAEQKKFWEYVALFFSEPVVDQSTSAAVAEKIDLNMGAFTACQESRRHAETITRVAAQGASLGIAATPTYFINGERFDGTPSEDELMEMVKRL